MDCSFLHLPIVLCLTATHHPELQSFYGSVNILGWEQGLSPTPCLVPNTVLNRRRMNGCNTSERVWDGSSIVLAFTVRPRVEPQKVLELSGDNPVHGTQISSR